MLTMSTRLLFTSMHTAWEFRKGFRNYRICRKCFKRLIKCVTDI